MVKNIKLGDEVLFWSFYRSSMSSEDAYGTEPQVSFTVYEEYMEQAIGEVVYELGAFCFKYKYGNDKGNTIAIRDVILNTPIEFEEHYMFGFGGKISFEDEEFWGEDFYGKLPQSNENEWTNLDHENYWGTIKYHLQDKCKEFEVVG